MSLLPRFALILGLVLLSACAKEDLTQKPEPLGDFALGLNIVVADNVKKVPISRDATVEMWEAALTKAMADRFGRFEGTKLYNLGISVDGYALAPPGVPMVVKPKSILVVTANVWDDAAGKKLNEEGKQIHIFESFSPETFISSGLMQNKQKQMDNLAFNAAEQVEKWLRDNPEWFGLPAKYRPTAAPAPTVVSKP